MPNPASALNPQHSRTSWEVLKIPAAGVLPELNSQAWPVAKFPLGTAVWGRLRSLPPCCWLARSILPQPCVGKACVIHLQFARVFSCCKCGSDIISSSPHQKTETKFYILAIFIFYLELVLSMHVTFLQSLMYTCLEVYLCVRSITFVSVISSFVSLVCGDTVLGYG